MNAIYIGLLIIGTLLVVIPMLVLIVDLGAKYEMMRAHNRVEALFLQFWDRRAETVLFTWYMVRNELDVSGARPVDLEACNKRIEVCKSQRRSCRRKQLSGNRTVIISTLNESL